jgi:hypothetical protein
MSIRSKELREAWLRHFPDAPPALNRQNQPLNVPSDRYRTSSRQYEKIINQVFYSAYRRLENFIKEKCLADKYEFKLMPISSTEELRNLLELMRFARDEMSL